MFSESQFFLLEERVLNCTKPVTLNMWPALHMILLKFALIFIAVPLHNQEPIKSL